MFVHEKAYQVRDTAVESSVMTKVKGFGIYNNRVMDVADYVTPTQVQPHQGQRGGGTKRFPHFVSPPVQCGKNIRKLARRKQKNNNSKSNVSQWMDCNILLHQV